MAHDPEGVVTFEAAGKKFFAVFGFKAAKATEAHYNKPLIPAIQEAMPSLAPEDAGDPDKVLAASLGIRLTEMGRLFEFTLLKHHPELTEEDIEDLVDELGWQPVAEIVGKAIAACLEDGEDGDKPKANPPKRRRASKTG